MDGLYTDIIHKFILNLFSNEDKLLLNICYCISQVFFFVSDNIIKTNNPAILFQNFPQDCLYFSINIVWVV